MYQNEPQVVLSTKMYGDVPLQLNRQDKIDILIYITLNIYNNTYLDYSCIGN